MTQSYDRTKRAMDVVIAVSLLVLTLPIQAAALVIRIRLGSPVLFRQTRPGLHGEPFEMVKFRTMADVDPALGLVDDASRMTDLGRLLRSTSVDELPTLWHVVKGDLSLVGPRPLMMDYLQRYSPEQARRHEVRPGLTGLAQISGRNALSWEDRFRLDVDYVEHHTILRRSEDPAGNGDVRPETRRDQRRRGSHHVRVHGHTANHARHPMTAPPFIIGTRGLGRKVFSISEEHAARSWRSARRQPVRASQVSSCTLLNATALVVALPLADAKVIRELSDRAAASGRDVLILPLRDAAGFCVNRQFSSPAHERWQLMCAVARAWRPMKSTEDQGGSSATSVAPERFSGTAVTNLNARVDAARVDALVAMVRATSEERRMRGATGIRTVNEDCSFTVSSSGWKDAVGLS
jgi:lipopolysaccharide/colanic/teichoic acid biosynthesis glycosyltransferase